MGRFINNERKNDESQRKSRVHIGNNDGVIGVKWNDPERPNNQEDEVDV